MAQIKSLCATCPSFSANSPVSVQKFCLSLILILGLFAGFAHTAEEATPKKKKADTEEAKSDNAEAKKKKGKDKEGEEAAANDDFDIPVPIGDWIKGIKFPHYGEDGQLKILFNAEAARKTDDVHLEMVTLKIDAYDDDGKKFYIELPHSIFNLETRILDSDSRVLVSRDDFELTGDTGEFNTKTRFAKVKGNVKMIINSTEDFE